MAPNSVTRTPLDVEIEEKFKNFDGKTISHLQIEGLKRTRETAVRWLVKSQEGQIFSAKQLAIDLQALYNTGNLYDVVPQVTLGEEPNTADVKNHTEKTNGPLLPFFTQ